MSLSEELIKYNQAIQKLVRKLVGETGQLIFSKTPRISAVVIIQPWHDKNDHIAGHEKANYGTLCEQIDSI